MTFLGSEITNQQTNSTKPSTEPLLTASSRTACAASSGCRKSNGLTTAYLRRDTPNSPFAPFVWVELLLKTPLQPLQNPFSREDGRIRRRRPDHPLQPRVPRELPGAVERLDVPCLPLRSEPGAGRELRVRPLRQIGTVARCPLDLSYLRTRRLRQVRAFSFGVLSDYRPCIFCFCFLGTKGATQRPTTVNQAIATRCNWVRIEFGITKVIL